MDNDVKLYRPARVENRVSAPFSESPLSAPPYDEEDARVIRGYAAVFNRDSELMAVAMDNKLVLFTERIAPGAFSQALNNSDVRALFNHDPSFILGRKDAGTLFLEEDNIGLRYIVKLPDTFLGDVVYNGVKRGDITQSSFSFTVEEEEWLEPAEIGRPWTRTIKKIERLYDVSPVTFPAYPDTTAASRSLMEVIGSGANGVSTLKQAEAMLLLRYRFFLTLEKAS
jgi:HK97 family phage prohead protease